MSDPNYLQQKVYEDPNAPEMKEVIQEVPFSEPVPKGKRTKPRVSRWEDGAPAVFAQGMPTLLQNASREHLEAFLVKFRMEEIRGTLAALQSNTFHFRPKSKRTPSPEPTYDSSGKRSNTRENRIRNKLIKEQQDLIQKAIKLNPTFKPVGTPQTKQKKTKKIYIPTKKFPNYNFIGQILGPRGLTQKQLEKEVGAKIVIRGKGSVLSGKERRKGPDEDEDEELHVLILADNDEQMRIAADRIEKLLIPVPDVKNEHKQKQLELLAKLNGTYVGGRMSDSDFIRREVANVSCQYCGEPSHPSFDCPNKKKMQENSGVNVGKMTLEDEYSAFLNEIQEIEGTGNEESGEGSSAEAGGAAVGAAYFSQAGPMQMPYMPPGYPYAPYPPPPGAAASSGTPAEAAAPGGQYMGPYGGYPPYGAPPMVPGQRFPYPPPYGMYKGPGAGGEQGGETAAPGAAEGGGVPPAGYPGKAPPPYPFPYPPYMMPQQGYQPY